MLIFTDKKYTEAIEFYTKAIDLAPTVATYYGNRSIAYLRTEAFGYGLQDASKLLEVDKNYIKVGSSVINLYIICVCLSVCKHTCICVLQFMYAWMCVRVCIKTLSSLTFGCYTGKLMCQ